MQQTNCFGYYFDFDEQSTLVIRKLAASVDTVWFGGIALACCGTISTQYDNDKQIK